MLSQTKKCVRLCDAVFKYGYSAKVKTFHKFAAKCVKFIDGYPVSKSLTESNKFRISSQRNLRCFSITTNHVWWKHSRSPLDKNDWLRQKYLFLNWRGLSKSAEKADQDISKQEETPTDEWESLLSNDEKKQNIGSIPTRRENIFTVPNLLSLSRIVATPYIAYLILEGNFFLASSLLFIAGVTDILDGQIARRWPSQKSAFGTALDPLGDKILVTVLTLTLAKAGMLPLPLAVLIVGRDVALIVSVFYLRYRTCPPPVTLKRYFDPTLVNTQLSPTTISKVNTVLQVAVIWCAIIAPIFNVSDSLALQCLYGITGATTIWSGLSYIFNKNTVQILRDK